MPRRLALSLLLLALWVGPAAADDDFVERMAAEHASDSPVASEAASTAPASEVESSTVVYAELDGDEISGHLAQPAGGGAKAGVIVIQEWWGLNDNIRAMADRLAGEGYLALAVDLYEGEVADDREKARELATKASGRPERLAENLRQAKAYLASHGAERIGTVGWCFGGGWSLQTALALGDEIDATVIYYGRVPTEATELASLATPVLGHFGELDGGIPVDTVRAFEAALAELGKPATIHVYPDADHAFANPSGERYNEAAAEQAWERTLAFFAEHLGG